ncbi:MAG: Ribosomal large subunit pseudouridine synthase D [bacterium]|nr:Ribosomal large subunit pseudouridine synthase D [bacterium]
MSGHLRILPGPEDQEKRIDLFLAERLPDLSRTRIQDLIAHGQIHTSAGPVRKANFRLRNVSWVEIQMPPPTASLIRPEPHSIEILYQDQDIAVVVKPVGMPTHPTPSRTSGTLVNALLFHLKDLSGVGGVLRPGIVHRLDQVTSGLLVVAKHTRSHELLADLFRKRLVRKTYRAICLGADPGAEGVVEGALGRHPTRRRKMALLPAGRHSLTQFARAAARAPLVGLLLHPVTGRTHQIRVHLESLRCPIVLDTLYGYDPKRWPLPALNPLLRDYPGILLHAERLEFTHPTSREAMSFTAEAPEAFRRVWNEAFS